MLAERRRQRRVAGEAGRGLAGQPIGRALERAEQLLAELRAATAPDAAMLSVALRRIAQPGLTRGKNLPFARLPSTDATAMTADRKVTLFHSPSTRSSGALTLLYELGAEFDLHVLNFKASKNSARRLISPSIRWARSLQ